MAGFLKTIFHVDMDAFFVSVEELFDPLLKGKPVVVGGQRHERGVVSAASYEARKFGVHSALPLRAANQLHRKMKAETQLNCSIGIGSSRLIAKVSSAKAKPNGILWVVPGEEARFLAPLDVRDIPGVGKVTEQNLHALGIRKVGDLSRFDDVFLEERFGKWGLALAGKSRGEDAGGWFDTEVGADSDPKSISHEHTYNEDTAAQEQLESTLMRLSEMVGRRLRESGLYARTIQIKLRHKDFTTITRAHTLSAPTQLDTEIFEQVRTLFRKNWREGAQVRLLGVHASSFGEEAEQGDMLEGDRRK